MTFEYLDFYVCVLFIFQLQHEKAELEQHLEQEQEFQVNKLMKKIKKLENDTISKQLTLEQVSISSCQLSHDQPVLSNFDALRNRSEKYSTCSFTMETSFLK
jgi:hypothetical protein